MSKYEQMWKRLRGNVKDELEWVRTAEGVERNKSSQSFYAGKLSAYTDMLADMDMLEYAGESLDHLDD